MDLSDIARKLDLSQHKMLVRKAAKRRRLCDVQFDSSIIGVGEVCKAVICLEIAATRQKAVKLSGVSEKTCTRFFNSLQNGLDIKTTLDIRELGIQFGCVRLIPFVKKGSSLYKDRVMASLPSSRQASADFTRPVFTAVSFYLCAKKHKLKTDKVRLIEVCGTSESEFSCICAMTFLESRMRKDPKEAKGNRELLDVLPEKRKFSDGGYLSDGAERKDAEKVAYEDWKPTVLSSNKKSTEAPCKRTTLSILKQVSETELKAV